MSQSKIRNHAPRFWFYTKDDWDGGWLPQRGGDEYLRKTVVFRLSKKHFIVIPYKKCKCEFCEHQRNNPAFRLTESDAIDPDTGELDHSFIWYLIDIWKYSGNRLPAHEYFEWSVEEFLDWRYNNILPKE